MTVPAHIVEIKTRLRRGTITKDEYDTLVEWQGYPPDWRPQRSHAAQHGILEGKVKSSPT